MISGFNGKYSFLSNFYEAPFPYKGVVAKTGEHAFQATKTLVIPERLEILAAATPGEAKALGRRCTMRSNWETYKDAVMLDVVRAKFTTDHGLAKMLLETGDRRLVEENHWGDKYWGVCRGEGLNRLGEILEHVRTEIKDSGVFV